MSVETVMKGGLKIHGIDVSYDSTQILSGVTFEVERGEFVGIIGPNGCGKTTLLRTLSRVLKPKAGAVLLDESDIFNIPSRRFAQELAVVPQDTEAVFDFTALEVVLMGRSPHLSRFQVEGSKDVEIARAAMAETDTLHIADRAVNTLSGGELQRVIIARGLAQHPRILLLDEPTSHLDLSYQFEILDLVRRLNREQSLTVIAVLHDLNLAAQYCDRLIMLGSGQVQAVGRPEDVLTSENVRRIYGAEVWVRKHPTSGRPYIIAGVGRTDMGQGSADKRCRVHVICGGGTGAPIIAKLFRRGFSLTAGVLNQGDTDLEVAESLGVKCCTCPPFTEVSAEAEAANLEMIKQADAVVLSDMPFGQWNLRNLDAAREALEMGKPLFLIRPESVKDRDFTGKASAVFEEMLSSGAVPVSDPNELVAELASSKHH